MPLKVFIFLVINFTALGLGSLFTSNGVGSEWYTHLNKAPWTPPGWFFGAAWTTIMVLFAIYMASIWQSTHSKNVLIALFSLQWILNVAWNPVFFKFQQASWGLLIIVCLTLLVGFFLIRYYPVLKLKSLLIVPYFGWLLIATSLNAFILIRN